MVTESQLTKYKKWLKFKNLVKELFLSFDLTEVETPTLVEGPAFEAQLEVFTTDFIIENLQKKFYLPTSPEIHLKKLIAFGLSGIFEIKKCFRNGELGPIHEPEFNMLEWYRPGDDLAHLCSDLEVLLNHLITKDWVEGPVQKIQKVSYSDIFLQYLNFPLSVQTTREDLLQLAKEMNLEPSGSETKQILCDWLFVAKIEPSIDKNTPTIIHSYPPWVQTLAKVNEAGWADRFEFYFRGMEIANAFNELLDYKEHENRWNKILQLRSQLNLPPLNRDEEFFALIKKGLPPTVGIALGLERLFMACQNLEGIADFNVFAKFKKF
ncbi:MAG: hypothetical protein H6625_07990 [Bdellovibrionaceae bacterium]|nr:hypothetical protein [Pseudobdellovibrionaceae bacterium]